MSEISAVTARQFFSEVDPFRVLPPKELDQLASLAIVETYDKGDSIYNEGDPADSVWVLKEGRIQIFKYTSGGHPQAIESLGPKELFGTLCRLGNNGRSYPCTAVTAKRSTVIRIPDRTFLDFYNRFPALVMGVCSLCSQRLNAMQGLSCNAQEPVEKRIAGILMQLHREHGTIIPFTKREIAELAATTVETTIRTMSAFAKKGWIASERGKVSVREPAEIKKLLEAPC